MNEPQKFHNLFHNEETLLKFFNSYREMIKNVGCFYMGYLLEDRESFVRAGFTTSEEWGKEYLNIHINHCHLWNQVQKFFNESSLNSFILPWSTVTDTTSHQKDIVLRRAELNISSDGISFCKKLGNFREYYYFAPEVKQKNFLQYVTKNIELIKSEINIFRKNSINLINENKMRATTYGKSENIFNNN